jgi:hypothetical protein
LRDLNAIGVDALQGVLLQGLMRTNGVVLELMLNPFGVLDIPQQLEIPRFANEGEQLTVSARQC